jgi:hypothetical protein
MRRVRQQHTVECAAATRQSGSRGNHSLSQLQKSNLKRKTSCNSRHTENPHPGRFRKDDLERFRRDTARQRLSPPLTVVAPQRPGLDRRGELPTESDRTRALCPGATFRRRCALTPASQPTKPPHRQRSARIFTTLPPGPKFYDQHRISLPPRSQAPGDQRHAKAPPRVDSP